MLIGIENCCVTFQPLNTADKIELSEQCFVIVTHLELYVDRCEGHDLSPHKLALNRQKANVNVTSN